MKTIAVIADRFLPVTQTFVYEEITGIQNYRVIALTQKKMNEELFPFENLYECSDIMAVKEFAKIIKKKKARLIHIKFGTTALNFIGLKKETGLPVIVSFHGFDASTRLRSSITLSKYRKHLFPVADHIITVSQKLKDNLVKAGCPAQKITVLWSGVDTQKFTYAPRSLHPHEPVRILSIGRLTEKKGFPYLIDAFAKLAAVRPNIELLIIGKGDLKDQLERQIKKLQLQSKITINGFVPHTGISQLMHRHHIFCLPSVTSPGGDEEGIPNVLKEAQATGMPVVSTYHSGIPHLIINEKNGLLVPEKDTEALAKKLLLMVDHPQLWGTYGQLGRAHVEEHFDKFKQAQKLEALYKRLIEKS